MAKIGVFFVSSCLLKVHGSSRETEKGDEWVVFRLGWRILDMLVSKIKERLMMLLNLCLKQIQILQAKFIFPEL